MKKIKFASLSLVFLFFSDCTVIAIPPDVSMPTTPPVVVPEQSTPMISPVESTNSSVNKLEEPNSNIVWVNTNNLGMIITLPLNKILLVSLDGKIEDNIEYQWVPDLFWQNSSIYTKDGILEMMGTEAYKKSLFTSGLQLRGERFYFLPRSVGSTILTFNFNKTLKDPNINPSGQVETFGLIKFIINVVPAENVNNQLVQ